MGWIEDLLKEVPLSAVLKERVELADQKYEAAMRENEALKRRLTNLEKENAELRARLPHGQEIGDDTVRVLVHLFKTHEMDDQDVGAMARALTMERGVLQYHLDRLDEAKLAECTGGNYVDGHVYWALTPEGRRYAVERKLI
jgi:DNA-binding transcriptional ArsR family regulator